MTDEYGMKREPGGPYRRNCMPPPPKPVRRKWWEVVRPRYVAAVGWAGCLALVCYAVGQSGGYWWAPLAMLGSIGATALLAVLTVLARWPWERKQ